MRRSKLELYQELLCALKKKACTVDEVAYECDTDCVLLEERLAFLISNNLVHIEIRRDTQAGYALSHRGVTVVKTLAVAKRLERLQTSIEASERELNTVQATTNQRGIKANRTT
jgi:predicted transcriptional regulator